MQTALSRECPSCTRETDAASCPECQVPTLSRESLELVPGTIFAGKFRIEQRLGQGAMSTVYRAHQLAMDRPVALKILKSSASSDDLGVRRFYRELRATARVEHPNTIRVYDFGHTDRGELYLAVELLQGRTLFDALHQDGVFDGARVVRVATQVAKALGAAHRAGVIHRDLKPENLFLLDLYGERDFVKVLDFGIARVHGGGDGPDAGRTTFGAVVGTPLYMSPEHVNGNLDGRSDLYSLGVVMYAMVTGHEPFGGKDPVQILMQHLTAEPPPPSSWRPVAAPLEALILRLLSKDPAGRSQSAEALIDELAAVARVLPDEDRTAVTPALPAALLHDLAARTTPEPHVRSLHGADTQIVPQPVDPGTPAKPDEPASLRLAATGVIPMAHPPASRLRHTEIAPDQLATVTLRAAVATRPQASRRWLLAGGVAVAAVSVAWLVVGNNSGASSDASREAPAVVLPVAPASPFEVAAPDGAPLAQPVAEAPRQAATSPGTAPAPAAPALPKTAVVEPVPAAARAEAANAGSRVETPSPAVEATAAGVERNPARRGGVPPETVPREPAPVKVAVTSTPSGAVVFQDGRRVGVTPTSVELSSGSPGALRLRLRGYEDRVVSFVAGKDDAVHAALTRAAGGASGAGKSEPKQTEPPKPLTFEKWD
ncbi:MAG: hypothetical protein AMXMBFR64_11460 [Myxococcales bacterium]